LEKIFFPVNILDAHWTLVIALMQEKRILYRDSFGNGGHIYTDAIKRYIVDEMREKRGHTMTQAEQDEWVVEPLPPVHSPRQNNGFDCGTFVCMYADFLLQNLPEQFSQEDMPMLRLKICYCILTGSLLYTV
jgi:Ulp1 family protease